MQLKQLSLTLALAGMLSAQAYANEAVFEVVATQAEPVNALSKEDMASLFGAEEMGKPMQVAVLSGREMRETEGALWANVVGGLAGGISSTYGYFSSVDRYGQTGSGVIGAFTGGFIGGALSPVRGIGSLAGTLAGGYASSYASNYISNWPSYGSWGSTGVSSWPSYGSWGSTGVSSWAPIGSGWGI